jgi:hypothetical protein
MPEEPGPEKATRPALVNWNRLAPVITGIITVPLLAGAVAVGWRTWERRTQELDCRKACRVGLEAIGGALNAYAADCGGDFPLALKDLYPSYLRGAYCLFCPSDPLFPGYGTHLERAINPGGGFTYAPGRRAEMPGGIILACDRSPEVHRRNGLEGGRNVLYLNGRAEWWPVSREAEFQRTLAAQRAAVEAWRKSGKPVESFGEFYQPPADRKD